MECTSWNEEDWFTLIYTIEQGNCILMLGPDASAEQIDGQWRPLTQQLANELFNALDPDSYQENIDSKNLAQAAQYSKFHFLSHNYLQISLKYPKVFPTYNDQITRRENNGISAKSCQRCRTS